MEMANNFLVTSIIFDVNILRLGQCKLKLQAARLAVIYLDVAAVEEYGILDYRET